MFKSFVRQPVHARELLEEFNVRKSLASTICMILVAALLFWLDSGGGAVITLLKLCLSFAVPFCSLAILARWHIAEINLQTVAIVTVLSILTGSLLASAFALQFSLGLMSNWRIFGFEILTTFAFSAFFIGLMLVSAVVSQQARNISDAQRQILEAKLAALQAQIEPHFLMNTLANLRHLLKQDTRRAMQMLDHLSGFLQGSLQQSRLTWTTLGDEVDAARHYLEIMCIRFGERLRVNIDIAPAIRHHALPPFLLQILVENAVVHGIEPNESGGIIFIFAQQKNDEIVLSVKDTGVGFGVSDAKGNGVGLRIIRERLLTVYGGRAQLLLINGVDGTIAELHIPT